MPETGKSVTEKKRKDHLSAKGRKDSSLRLAKEIRETPRLPPKWKKERPKRRGGKFHIDPEISQGYYLIPWGREEVRRCYRGSGKMGRKKKDSLPGLKGRRDSGTWEERG